ncbi:hypothetical protein T02_7954 [Trichinella nativa]|uniref:Uncharacterized protein n=1 Tax=Trichinella nativa TaxID=6335 RepID=A0A0V1LP38_9BILA|nr:hypothetical protein T02_7954 [Trichinella nativa]
MISTNIYQQTRAFTDLSVLKKIFFSNCVGFLLFSTKNTPRRRYKIIYIEHHNILKAAIHRS